MTHFTARRVPLVMIERSRVFGESPETAPCVMGTLLVSILTFLSLWLKHKGKVSGYHGAVLSDTFKQTKKRMTKKGGKQPNSADQWVVMSARWDERGNMFAHWPLMEWTEGWR